MNNSSSSDWRDKYHQALAEFEGKQKLWSQEEAGLYKSILRLIFSYTGLDEELDQHLSSMRDSLRKESSNSARGKIIGPVIEEVMLYAQQRDEQQNDIAAGHLLYLLETLKLPDKFNGQLKSIKKTLRKSSEDENIHGCIDQLSALISKTGKEGGAATERIQLKADDPLSQLLENLSLPGDLGIEIISLRKRAGEIEEEQERLKIIQDLVQVLSEQGRDTGADAASREIFFHFKETLLELFEWLAIPKEYNKRIENLKSQIIKLENNPDLAAILRDTAVVINDLQAALQIELSDVQNFLANVTLRLEEIENCFRDMAKSETESYKQTQQLNNDIRSNVLNIREGITESEDLNVIKKSIDYRLTYIEQSVEAYLQSTQARQQEWEEKVNLLKGRLDSMKGETTKLHKRIQEEYKKAKTDTLTGISNRLAYNEKIKQEFARWQRYAQPLSICIIDVDKFKGVNDGYGHKAGDRVLKTIAEVCATKTRKMDFIARYGGEEFVLVLPQTRLDKAMVVAENLRQEIEKCKFHYDRKTVPITVSCGLAQMREGDTTESVFERADKALYAAKDRGRNCCLDETEI